jgi:hypothetical protein
LDKDPPAEGKRGNINKSNRAFIVNVGAGTWTVGECDNDGKPLPSGCTTQSFLPDLGAQAWELVSIVTYSQNGGQSLGGRTSTDSGFNTGASLSGAALNGITTQERWVFKRPKL